MSSDSNEIEIEVVAYSGYKANERPLSFMLDGRKRDVKEVVDQWIGPDLDYFRVIADDGLLYLLKWNRSLDRWFLEKKG
jgi:hypothetical protein